MFVVVMGFRFANSEKEAFQKSLDKAKRRVERERKAKYIEYGKITLEYSKIRVLCSNTVKYSQIRVSIENPTTFDRKPHLSPLAAFSPSVCLFVPGGVSCRKRHSTVVENAR